MPRLVYLTSALRDLAKIASDIEAVSQSRDAALTFTEKLTDHCEHIARLPGLLGRSRVELRAEYRSLTFGSYVIFFRYIDSAVAREVLEIIHVVHGARDLEAFFRGGAGGPERTQALKRLSLVRSGAERLPPRARRGKGGAKGSAMDKAELTKLRAHLRRSFGCDLIDVQPHSRKQDAAEVRLGEARLGEIIVDEEDGDRSFFFEMKVPVDRAALQGFLRKRFGNDKLTIAARMKKTDSVELNNGPEHIGVLTVDDAKGESWTLEMAILDIDLDDV